MKLIKKILVVFFVMHSSCLLFAQAINPNLIYFYSHYASLTATSPVIYSYDPSAAISANNPTTTNVPIVSSTRQNIALMPNIFGGTLNPTFFNADIFSPFNNSRPIRYWNGQNWINSSIPSLNLNSNNIPSGSAGCGNFFYVLNNPSANANVPPSNTEIYKSSGVGSPSLIATFTNQLCVDDLVADCNCNFYVLDNNVPQFLHMYDSNGNALCTYSVTNPISRSPIYNGVSWNGGMATIGNTLYVRTGDSPFVSQSNPYRLSGMGGGAGGFYMAVLGGSSITFTPIIGFVNAEDFATVPMCFTNSITATASSGTLNCTTFTAALTASVNTPLSPVSFSWSGPGVVAGSATNAVASASVAGNYTCVINAGGCMPAQPPTQTIVTTSVFSSTIPPISFVNPTPNVCVNGNTPMFATPNFSTYQYTWQGPGIVSGANQDTVFINAAGVYTLFVSDTYNACNFSTTVNTFAAPSLSFSLSSPSLCLQNIFNSPNTISLSASGANTAAGNYSLFTNTGFSISANTGTNYIIGPLPPYSNFNSNPTLTLAVFDGTCANTAPVNFLAVANPSIYISPVSASICAGFSKTFTAAGANNYSWVPAINLNNAFNNVVVANPGLTTIYTIQATNAYGCYAMPNNATLNVIPLPTLSLLPNNPAICLNTNNVTLTALSNATAFVWSPTLGLSSGNSSVVLASANVTKTYSVTAFLNACSITNTITVSVVPPPNLFLSLSSNSFCAQAFNGSPNSITLTAGGANVYTLSTGPQFHNSNPSGPVSPVSLVPPYTNPGIATATLLGSNGVCTVSTSAVFSVIDNPSISVNNPTPVICAGETFTYTNSGAASYVWSSSTPGSTLFTTGNVAVAHPSINSVFSVFGGSLGCNSALQTTTITVKPLPVLTLSPNPIQVCLGKAVSIVAVSNASSFFWQPASWLSNVTDQAVMASPPQNQNYTVLATLDNCTTSAIASVSVLPLPQPVITANSTTLCLNTSLELNGSGGLTYAWRAPNGLQYFGQQIKINANHLSFSGLYTLTVKDNNQCLASKSISISVLNVPLGYLKSLQTSNCVPFWAELDFVTNSGNITSSNFNVFNQKGDFIKNLSRKDNRLSAYFSDPGNYFIKGQITAATGCANTIDYPVIAYPKPKADFDFYPKNPIEGVDVVEFIADEKGVSNFEWVFGNGAFNASNGSGAAENGATAKKRFENAGIYPVVLLVTNEYDCIDTLIKPVTVIGDYNVYIPNAFTPNGNGHNEIFLPSVRNVRSFQLRIFNRWGENVFLSNDAQVGWDGTYQGQDCKQDVYTYKLIVKPLNEDEKVYTGAVSLIR
jgi:gliding motility-associated-like protein